MKHLSGARQGKKERAKEMSGEEQRRREAMVKSWRVEIIEKRSQEMNRMIIEKRTRLNTSSAQVSSTYGVPEGLWQLKSPRQNKF